MFYLWVVLPLTWTIWKQRCQLVYRKLLLSNRVVKCSKWRLKCWYPVWCCLHSCSVRAAAEISAKPDVPDARAMMEAIVVFSKAFNGASVTALVPLPQLQVLSLLCQSFLHAGRVGNDFLLDNKTTEEQEWVKGWIFDIPLYFHFYFVSALNGSILINKKNPILNGSRWACP